MKTAKKKCLALLLTLTLCPAPTCALASGEAELPPEENVILEVEEAPVEEAPVEETPVEEAPVEEVPAEEAPALDGAGGSCGAGLTWELTDDGVFTISGSGSVDNYNYFGGGEKHAPWYGSRSAIRSVVIGGGVSRTGQFTFYNCKNLTDVTIQSGVRTIGTGTFLQCTALTEVELPDTVTAIEVNAFNGCTALHTVHIPVSVTSVTAHAFSWCESLSDVYYGGTEAQWNALTADISADSELMKATVHFGGPAVRLGDLTGDGQVNRQDRVYLARSLAGWSGYTAPADLPMSAADVNLDGVVNRQDRVYLARALAGWQGYSLTD